MVTFAGGSGASSSSSAGRNLQEGHGLVMSLTTMAAERASAASSRRGGAPMGSARARLISASSPAGVGGGPAAALGVIKPSRLAAGSSKGSSPSPYGIESFTTASSPSPSAETSG